MTWAYGRPIWTVWALPPKMCIRDSVITVLGLNLLGDGLRDVLDPKLRRER